MEEEEEESGQEQAKEESPNQLPAIDATAFAESLAKAQDVIEKTNEQIAKFARNEAKNQSRIKRLESLVEGNAQQLQALIESNQEAQKLNTELREENREIVLQLQKQQQGGQEAANKCDQNVNRPPRKIDKPLVGYAYGPISRELSGLVVRKDKWETCILASFGQVSTICKSEYNHRAKLVNDCLPRMTK